MESTPEQCLMSLEFTVGVVKQHTVEQWAELSGGDVSVSLAACREDLPEPICIYSDNKVIYVEGDKERRVYPAQFSVICRPKLEEMRSVKDVFKKEITIEEAIKAINGDCTQSNLLTTAGLTPENRLNLFGFRMPNSTYNEGIVKSFLTEPNIFFSLTDAIIKSYRV